MCVPSFPKQFKCQWIEVLSSLRKRRYESKRESFWWWSHEESRETEKRDALKKSKRQTKRQKSNENKLRSQPQKERRISTNHLKRKRLEGQEEKLETFNQVFAGDSILRHRRANQADCYFPRIESCDSRPESTVLVEALQVKRWPRRSSSSPVWLRRLGWEDLVEKTWLRRLLVFLLFRRQSCYSGLSSARIASTLPL